MPAIEGPQGVPRAAWAPLSRPGCVNVEGRLLLVEDDLAVAMLKLDAEATIDEHSAPHPIDVVCLEGEGFISVEDQVHSFRAGQTMRWPPGRVHRLWTADRSMVTLMLERLSG